MLLGSGLFLAALLVFFPEMRSRIYGPILMMAIAMVVGLLVYWGKTKAAVMGLVYGGWIAITAVALMYDGVRAPVYYTYPLLIVLVGWLFSVRAAMVVAGLTSASTVGLVVANAYGWHHSAVSPDRLAPPVLHGVVMIMVFMLTALLVKTLVATYQRHLMALRLASQALSQHASDLELARADLFHAQAVSKVGSWTYDMARDTVELSNETCRIFGLDDHSKGTEKAYLGRVDPRDRLMVSQAWAKALDGAAFDVTHRITVAGREVWVHQSAEVLQGPDGRPVKAVGTSQDITERKQAEILLRQSESKFANAFTSCPLSASIVTLGDGLYLEANDNYLRDFGWSRHELIGTTALSCGLWANAQDRLEWVHVMQTHGHVLDHETVWLHRNGEPRNVSIAARVIDHGGVPCVLAYVTDITARRRADAQIHSLAFFDPLTGLPNRRLLIDRLGLALVATTQQQRLGALIFIDLDNFKVLNDTHGHDMGDRLLQEVAQRLKASVRQGDIVSRHGGDEFVVMLEDLDHPVDRAANEADMVAQKILANLAHDYHFGSLRFRSTPSIGVTLFGEQDEKLEEPLRRADTAMYQAKYAGRNAVKFFDPEMQATVTARATLERELRTAASENQFVLHYQPQVTSEGRVVGAEALVRWIHPTRGTVQPAEFIPMAESTDLILPIGALVLEAACRQLAQWATIPALQHLSIAVNVSARQFQQNDFVGQVLEALARTGADPRRLKLELTESVAVHNVDVLIQKMQALKDHGVGFSLDDFGTGYSSLSHLKMLPLDQLKIDQSFVRDILVDANDAAIAKMVVLLAQSLGLSVIAEGVESYAQEVALFDQGCTTFQGFHFSVPLDAVKFQQYFARQNGIASSGLSTQAHAG